jgi:DNA polymerase III subunit chi
MPRADFSVLEGSDARDRWKLACQEIEKAFLADERILVWLENDTDVAQFDDLLWTFADRSFVPHEPLGPESDWEQTPVLLSASRVPAAAPQVIVNLASGIPPGVAAAERIVEIVDADAARRLAGRERYRQYRALGLEPTTHKRGAATP